MAPNAMNVVFIIISFRDQITIFNIMTERAMKDDNVNGKDDNDDANDDDNDSICAYASTIT